VVDTTATIDTASALAIMRARLATTPVATSNSGMPDGSTREEEAREIEYPAPASLDSRFV